MSTLFDELSYFKFYLNDVLTEAEILIGVVRQGRYIDVRLRNGTVIPNVDIYEQKMEELVTIRDNYISSIYSKKKGVKDWVKLVQQRLQ